ncbi:MAG: hypothetical protein PHZ03_01020 [Syntrophomonas sp.]|nr:hypothetical protein [Syntrophomonas sp.]
MTRDEVLAGLTDLIRDRESLINPTDQDENNVFQHDIEVLKSALELMVGRHSIYLYIDLSGS